MAKQSRSAANQIIDFPALRSYLRTNLPPKLGTRRKDSSFIQLAAPKGPLDSLVRFIESLSCGLSFF